MNKTKDIELKLENNKNLIRGEFIKIQGKVSKVIQALRTSFVSAKQSAEKIIGLSQDIDNAKNAKDHFNVDYRKLYKDVEECLKKHNDSFQKEYQGITEKILGFCSNMESLTENMDCELITKRELSALHEETNKLNSEVASREEEKKKMQEEISDWKRKTDNETSNDFLGKKSFLSVIIICI